MSTRATPVQGPGNAPWPKLVGLTVLRPTVDPLLESWVARGGSMTLVGPRGSGRTHLLSRALRDLDRRGSAVIDLWPGRFAGAALVAARDAAGIHAPLPPFPDAGRRCRAAVHELLEHFRAAGHGAVWVVADDADQLRADPFLRQALAELQHAPDVHLLASSSEPMAGSTSVPLDCLDVDSYRHLSDSIGASDVAWAASHLHPGPALATLVAHPEGAAVNGWQSRHRLAGLSPEASALLTQLSLSCVPLQIPDGQLVAERSELVDRALAIDSRRGLRLWSPACARDLSELLPTGASVHAKLWSGLPARHPARVPHAIPLSHSNVDSLPAALVHLAGFDPIRATRWGRRLLRHRADPDLARVTAAAALDAGRRPEGVRVLLSTAAHVPAATAADLLATAGLLCFRPPVDLAAARQCLSAAHGLPDAPVVSPRAVQVLDARLKAASGATASALAIIRTAADSPPQLTGHLHVHRLLLEAEGWAQLGRLDEALATINLLAGQTGPAVREQAALAAARHLRDAGRVLDASAALVRAAAIDRSRPDPARVRYLDEAAQLASEGGDPGAAIAHLNAAIQLSTRPGSVAVSVNRLRPRLAATLLDVDRLTDALEVARTCWSDATIDAGIRHQAATVAADVCIALEDASAATTWLDHADATLSADAPPSKRLRVERRRCEVDLQSGAPGAVERIRAASRAAHRALAGRELSHLRALHALALAQAHRHAEVGPTLERALRPLRDAGASRLLAEVRLRGGQAWLLTGELEEARKMLGSALVWAEETGHLHIRNQAADLLDHARPRPGSPDAQLQRLVDITTGLAREREPDRVRQRAITACAELLQADRVFILDVKDGQAEVTAAWHTDGQSPGAPSSSVLRAILGHGREMAVSDIGERADLRAQTSIVARRLRSVMCVPMHRYDTTGPVLSGLVYVDSPARPQRESDRSLRILRAIAAHASAALHAAQSLAMAEERVRRATELIHDLRSPAASLSMSGEELSMAEDAPVWVRETGRLIDQQAQRLLRVAEGHLSGARSAPAEVDINQLAADLGRSLGPLARSQGRSLLVESVGKGTVWSVDDDLLRILTNLVHNAIRHTPVGTAVRLSTLVDGDEVVVQVADDGPGLTEEQLQTIFQAGVRGPGGGHGLGLSIARRLARLWGGELSAMNRPSAGACFSLRLPLWQAE